MYFIHFSLFPVTPRRSSSFCYQIVVRETENRQLLHLFLALPDESVALTGAGPYRLILDFDRITTEQAATRRGFRRVGNMNLDGFFAKSLSCDPAHAQFRFPRFIDQYRIR